ncbi:hypothetical protein FX995_05585 [Pseudoalteromonas flavipulchra]|nr:hypothetical protein [Pseudoalteromonas flavipulchra]
MEVNSTQLALKLAARKALIIRSSGYLADVNCWAKFRSGIACAVVFTVSAGSACYFFRLFSI